MLRAGNVYDIDDSQYVLLRLLDSNSMPGYLLASLNSLGTRLHEACRTKGMENILFREQARLLGRLGRVDITDYIREIIMQDYRLLPRPYRWGYVYAAPLGMDLVQSVSQVGNTAYCTLLHLDWLSWRGIIIRDSSLDSYNHSLIGYCGEANIWPHLEHFLDREDT